MDEPWLVGALELGERIRRRDVSATEVVDAFIERIEAVDGDVNAVVVRAFDRARAEAAAADRRADDGTSLGALDGVPFTVKDVIETEGVATVAGLPERRTTVPAADAVVVARLRAAGAIMLGKTNTPPSGAGGVTDNPVFGRTDNPYALDRWVAGSSGGEAAAQAYGASAFGIGSDSGGSLRVPAHACGVTTLRPTSGRVPNTGALEHPGGLSDARTQIGPIARSATDLLPILRAIAGPDGRDSGVVPVPLGDVEPVDVSRLRVATPRDATTDRTTLAAVQAAADALAAVGAEISHEGFDPEIERAFEISRRYWRWSELTGEETGTLLEDWDAFRTDALATMDRFDVLLGPASPTSARPHGEGLERMFEHTLGASLTGQPAVVVRGGSDVDGLPVGVQLVGPVWREELAVAAALVVERASGGWQPSPR
jgi:amidase